MDMDDEDDDQDVQGRPGQIPLPDNQSENEQ